ncbi:MAG: ABC transporter ATP-binding protein [Anaerolineales bacterium]
MSEPLLTLEHVTRTFVVKGQTIKAVDDVNLTISAGDVMCLVGESGCGKTTTGRMIAGLLPVSSGRILFRGQDIANLARADRKPYRLGVQMVHQDPYASLNPVQTVYDTLAAPLEHHHFTRGEAETRRRVRELLQIVDLTPPDDFLEKYPHQLSGGQRQRVAVARALTVRPAFIVADEAVSMVDVSIRISLLKMFARLKDEMGVGVLLITHDLALAKYFAWEGRIGVMYLGRLVELGSAPGVIDHPQHPYTQVLLSAIPEVDPEATRAHRRIELRSADMPSLLHLPSGCPFHPRCPVFAGEVCETVLPPLKRARWGSEAACHLAESDEP